MNSSEFGLIVVKFKLRRCAIESLVLHLPMEECFQPLDLVKGELVLLDGVDKLQCDIFVSVIDVLASD